MRSEDIRNRQWTEGERRVIRNISKRQQTEQGISSHSNEIPSLTSEQLRAMVRLREARPRKVAVSLRLDARVLEWLKSKGEGHLTRINDILANLMEAELGKHSER
jgi:uncharacterized protein (DUF4415 family)